MKPSINKVLKGFGVIALFSFIIISCNKATDASSTSIPVQALSIHLSDDPSLYNSVFIDIKFVEVKIDTNLNHDANFDNDDHDQDNDHKDHDAFGKWDTLQIRPGVYDVMKFRNGLDTLLGHATIPKSRIEKVRITLGDNNSVVVNNVSHPLVLAPGSNNYAYIKISDDDLDKKNDNLDLWIDFDLAQSIVEHNGIYYLRPFLKPFGMEKFGRIEGKVLPRDARAVVQAIKGADVSTAVPDAGEGNYKIRGLAEGTYSVLLKGSNGFQDTTLNNIIVHAGAETHIPTITLHK